MDACPSTFALDDAEIHGGALAAGIARHLDGCARCRARADEREALGRRFDDALAAPLWNRVDAGRRRARRWSWGVLAPALAAAALAIVLVARPGQPYRATKGDLTVEIAARRAGAVFAVEGATEVKAGDELQFIVRAGGAAERYVLIGSVDGTGQFSPFYPASLDGRSVAVPTGGAPLAPPVVLDDAPGPERVVVVLSDRPLDARALAPLIQQRAATLDLASPLGGGEAAVRWIVLSKGEARRMRP
ncbi:MAG TPA: hypothetical protein VHU40_05230 [Polyangia bacterium]|nr:hypothetical protein [Polyangia bacterium]